MKYCKECGHVLREGAQFCKECGIPVNTLANQQSKEQHTYQQPAQPVMRQPMSRKKKILLTSSIVALVILFGGYKTAEILTSKDRLIDNFETALFEKDAAAVTKLLSTHDKKAEINEKTIKGFMNYFEKNPDEVGNLIQTLKAESKLIDKSEKSKTELKDPANDFLNTRLVSLERNGSFFVFDRYTLSIPTVYLTLSTNYKDANLYIDGNKVAKSNKPDYKKTVGPYFPGIYKFKADLKTDFVDLKKEEEKVLDEIKEEVELHLDGKNVRVDTGIGNFKSDLKGKLFINGKDVQINPFQTSTFGPILTDGSMKIGIEVETPWGNLKTDDTPINDSTVYFNLGNNKELQEQIINKIMKFNDQYLAAITSGDTSKLTFATPNYISITKDIIKSNAQYHQMYRGRHLSTSFDLDSFHLTHANNQWLVNVNTLENYNEDYFSKGQTPLLQDSTNEFSYTLVFDEKNKTWLVDNKDSSWAFNNENSKEVKVEKPMMYSTNGAIVETTEATSYSKDTIEAYMNEYLTASVSAINHFNFSIMEGYLTSTGKSYKESKNYIEYLKKKGITEDLLSVNVTNMEATENGYHLYTEEQYNIHYPEGTKKKAYKSEYQLIQDGSQLKVDSLVQTTEITQ